MINKELKRLSRRELVDIIYQLKKNEQEMQEQIDALEKALEEKRIRIAQAGSIADAATDITNILSTAQKTADIYLQEIACMKEETEKECTKIIEETKQIVEKILADGQNQYPQDYEKWQQLQADIKNLKNSD